jgi:hypothetical protein
MKHHQIGRSDTTSPSEPICQAVPHQTQSRCRFVCITEFYNSSENSLHWVRGPTPTSWTRAVIQSLKSEVTKGLGPKDCDGPRWEGSPAINRVKTEPRWGVLPWPRGKHHSLSESSARA